MKSGPVTVSHVDPMTLPVGVQRFDGTNGRTWRQVSESDCRRSPVVQAAAEWIGEHDLSTFATFTYSDQYANAHKVFSTRACMNDVKRFLRGLGYKNGWMVAVESHKERTVPHAHVLMRSDLSRELVWNEWTNVSKRGRSRILPVLEGGVLYVCKYVLKAENDESWDFSF